MSKKYGDNQVPVGLRLSLAESQALADRLEKAPPIATNNSIRDVLLSGKEAEQARDWPFMSPEEYAKKWLNAADPEKLDLSEVLNTRDVPDDKLAEERRKLAADQAASIASNLEVESGTDDDIPEPPEWEPRDMKTTVITRDNIDHFNNPFA